MKKILSVIDSAYRASLEEQDDAGLWFTAAVKQAGAQVDVLLTGNAVNYAVSGLPLAPFRSGGGSIAHPMDPLGDIRRMSAKGVKFFLVREDAEERGLVGLLAPEIETMARIRLARFIDAYDLIWHW